jgi:1H-pyrrole-2-carbonyl-[peptidyl-carrier protein] brominase
MKVPVVIIGGGPAGSATAMFLKKQGIGSTIIERMQFPRYHIGESMTGECGDRVRELGLEQEMNRRNFPIKHGACMFGAASDYKWYVPVASRDENWKIYPRPTWQVLRSDFDKMMLETALSRGTDFIHGEVAKPIVADDGTVRGLTVKDHRGKVFDIESEIVLDCSGQATFLANAGVAGPKFNGNYDKQMAVFSQVEGAIRDNDDTVLFYKTKYHWSWFIPLSKDVVSVGVVAPAAYFKEKKESKRDYLVRELRELNHELTRRLPEVKLVEGVRSIPNYSYQIRKFSGKGFLCVGDAHRFIDPIFSFGVCVSLCEAKKAAATVKGYMEGKGRDDDDPFAAHALNVEQGIDVVEDMMDTFWEHPFSFARLVHTQLDEMIDIFAGRLWERQPSITLAKMRRMLKRERSYDQREETSIPIGSRYHPERARIWEVGDPRIGIDVPGDLVRE